MPVCILAERLVARDEIARIDPVTVFERTSVDILLGGRRRWLVARPIPWEDRSWLLALIKRFYPRFGDRLHRAYQRASLPCPV